MYPQDHVDGSQTHFGIWHDVPCMLSGKQISTQQVLLACPLSCFTGLTLCPHRRDARLELLCTCLQGCILGPVFVLRLLLVLVSVLPFPCHPLAMGGVTITVAGGLSSQQLAPIQRPVTRDILMVTASMLYRVNWVECSPQTSHKVQHAVSLTLLHPRLAAWSPQQCTRGHCPCRASRVPA